MTRPTNVWLRVASDRVVELRRGHQPPAAPGDWWRLAHHAGQVLPPVGATVDPAEDEVVGTVTHRPDFLYAVRMVTWTSSGGRRHYNRLISQWRHVAPPEPDHVEVSDGRDPG